MNLLLLPATSDSYWPLIYEWDSSIDMPIKLYEFVNYSGEILRVPGIVIEWNMHIVHVETVVVGGINRT